MISKQKLKNLREEIVAGQGFEGVKVCVENEMKTGQMERILCQV